MDRLRRIRDVEVRWLSYELRPESSAPPSPEEERRTAAYRRKVDEHWPQVQAMAQGYGLTFGPRNRNARSRLALEGAKFAEDAGLIEPYARALFHAHFAEGRNLSDPNVLTELAESAGLDGAAFRHALDERALKARVDRELALGFMYKLSGVPAFIVGRKYLVVGAQPLETLVDVVDRCAA
ncbi:MAG: DsbA family protein [Chloroflexi bacterium]|nr:DsbA family protein [Chloroflexota bacterium]